MAIGSIDPATLDTFLALGDSFTEGLHDEVGPDGRHRGWADRVAEGLALRNGRVHYANLAIRGRLLDQVVAEQLPMALTLRPALVSFHAGPNDILRPRVDVSRLLATYTRTVARLRENGSEVLLFTVIGPPRAAHRTTRAGGRLARRFAAFNTCARRVADQYDCALADVGAVPALWDRRLWHEDRLHLTPEGHTRVAAAALEALGLDASGLSPAEPKRSVPKTSVPKTSVPVAQWRESLPVPEAPGRLTDVAGDLRWARTFLLPWVGRRLRGVSSGDALLPKRPAFTEVTAPRPA